MSLKEVLEECLYEEIYGIGQPYIEMLRHARALGDTASLDYLEKPLDEIKQALKKGSHLTTSESGFNAWLFHQDLKRCELYLTRVPPAYKERIALVKKHIQMLKLLDLSN